jgi:hypothetical protein
VVMPRNLPNPERMLVLQRFMSREVLEDSWTTIAPASQHPADVCWPDCGSSTTSRRGSDDLALLAGKTGALTRGAVLSVARSRVRAVERTDPEQPGASSRWR